MISIEIIPALEDNYIYAVTVPKSNHMLIVDPGDALPVFDFIKANGRELTHILLTHHHHDHIDGVESLIAETGAQVFGPTSSRALKEGELLNFDPYSFEAMVMPGHTLDQTLYFEKNEKVLFSGDTLFSLGCGRLFEGTHEQMFTSLQRIKTLPSTTKIYGGHEYTLKNIQFSIAYLQDQGASPIEIRPYKNLLEQVAVMREQKQPTMPSRLDFELKYNLFLKAQTLEEFKKLREARNQF